MGRLIDTSDLNNKIMMNKSDWGIFATQIDNLIAEVVMQVSTVEAIPKEQIDEMIAEIENCSETYVAGWDGKRSKTAKEMKQDILAIIHKYCD